MDIVGFLFIVALIVAMLAMGIWFIVFPVGRRKLAVVGVFAFISALLVAMLAMGIWIIVFPPCFHCGDRERSARSTTRSDLKNLMTAQEAYYADSGTYATDIGALVAAVEWSPTTDVTVEILVGTDSGHAARAHHEVVPDWTCAVWVGKDGYAALETLPPKLRDKLRQLVPLESGRTTTREGEVDCEKQ